MKQQLKETVIYQPNDGVKVTVSNKPVTDDNGRTFFEQGVTIKINAGWHVEKLAFASSDDLRMFIDSVDLEDPQQELPFPSQEGA